MKFLNKTISKFEKRTNSDTSLWRDILSWKEEFISHRFPIMLADVQLEKAKALLALNKPNFLYKYRGVNKYSLATINNSLVSLARPDTFNDPLDCHFIYDHQQLCITQGQFEDIRESMFRKPLKVYSFSEVMNSMPMWAHYADNHKGICIEHSIDLTLINSDYLYPVVYSNNPLDMTNFLMEYLGQRGQGAAITINSAFIRLGILIKSIEWGYEKEWRFVFPDESNQDLERISRKIGEISKVYLGYKISHADETSVRSLCESRGIPVQKMRPSPSRFEMEPF